jgi:hypothetical protein
MVDPAVRPLLALGLETLDGAKNMLVRRLVWHVLTLVLLAAAATSSLKSFEDRFGNDVCFWIECTATLLAALTELMAVRVHHRSLEYHSLGRQVMRRVMLLDATEPGGAKEYLDYVRPHFAPSVLLRAERRLATDDQLERYYCSVHAPGEQRLRDHLFESAFFSAKLYRFGSWISLGILLGFVAAAIAVAAAVAYPGLRSHEHFARFPVRLIIAVLVFLPACQELDHALLYRLGAGRLHDLLQRVEGLWDPRIPAPQLKLRLMADFGDYGADTTFAPPIRNIFYLLKDKELSVEVKARLDKLNQANAS